MKTPALNVFVLNDNTTIADKLKGYLERRFGEKITISLFSNSQSLFTKLDKNVDLVVLDDYLYDAVTNTGANISELVNKIKVMSDKTEVIVLSSEAGVEEKIRTMNIGANNEIIIPNKHGSWSKIHLTLYNIVSYPISFLMNEFKVTKFVSIFIMIFLTMAAVVLITLQLMK